MALFGAMTLAVAAVDNVHGARGGCASSPASASAARCRTPRRWPPSTCRCRQRPLAVTLTIVCVPLGATLAGLVAIPAAAALRLAHALPRRRRRCRLSRSSRSCRRPPRIAALPGAASRTLARADASLARMGHAVPADATFVDRQDAAAGARASIATLFQAAVPSRHARALGGLLLVPARGVSRLQLGAVDADRRRASARRSPAPASPRSTSAASPAPWPAAAASRAFGSRRSMLVDGRARDRQRRR